MGKYFIIPGTLHKVANLKEMQGISKIVNVYLNTSLMKIIFKISVLRKNRKMPVELEIG